ncbi:hypothetical protein R3P38DRAFT_2759403 [Favolaschia claudopus]|uniref:Uncharacterized protein n=1 Tax=Favolaschia claudopus TaxID=2862362 RepID=A0AAW0E8K1_9AGAR
MSLRQGVSRKDLRLQGTSAPLQGARDPVLAHTVLQRCYILAGKKKEEGERRLRMSGDCQPTREEHKEGRQQGRLEPPGWWKPIRNRTKAGLGRAGARPDEGGHVIGPDEGPGESEKAGELGKVGRSMGRLARKPRDERGLRSRLDKVEQVQVSKGGLAEGVGTSRMKVGQGYKEPDEFGQG